MADSPVDIDAYVATLPLERRAIAAEVRQVILSAEPRLTEAIRYGMPAFKLGGDTVIYFAVWAKHVGLYPIYRGDEVYEAEVGPWRSKTDTVNLPLNKPLPGPLIRRIVRMQIALGGTR